MKKGNKLEPKKTREISSLADRPVAASEVRELESQKTISANRVPTKIACYFCPSPHEWWPVDASTSFKHFLVRNRSQALKSTGKKSRPIPMLSNSSIGSMEHGSMLPLPPSPQNRLNIASSVSEPAAAFSLGAASPVNQPGALPRRTLTNGFGLAPTLGALLGP
ncbi:uncharacterized protein VTP21DRAFT_558 [Calcarisporiella thermophila]|uniref:uncharacterized protein n=1 Tax=Calcarisporiella thermophila TaxID=911321 RepID=UPI0037423C42